MTNFEYKRIFDTATPFYPTDEKLDALADFMSIREADEHSAIPAGYTYLTQFIDHDIMRDPLSSIQPWNVVFAKVKNQRTPFFNLESIYGITKKGEPVPSFLLQDKSRFIIGSTVPVSNSNVFQSDLSRHKDSPKAAIFDERNDENLIIAQIQVAFMKFHNAIVESIEGEDSVEKFEEARRKTIRHYQWIILKDLLPRIINKDILEDVKENEIEFYKPTDDDIFMPLEFSVGAYRTGHSMINNVYNWNKDFSGSVPRMPSIHDLMMQTGSKKFGGNGLTQLSSDWAVNWKWFFNIDDSENSEIRKFNHAKKINASISYRLGRLTKQFDYDRQFSLPAMDLFRSRMMGLPTGQDIADEIIINSKSGILTRKLQPQELADILKEKNILTIDMVNEFSENTPLLFYLLAEAEIQTRGETLGDVGSRLTAITFLELLKRSEYSILNLGSDFSSHSDFLGTDGKFGMPELLKYADQNTGFINPLGD